MEDKDMTYETEAHYKVEPKIKTVDISKESFDLDLNLQRVDIVIEDTRYIGAVDLRLCINNKIKSSPESEHDSISGDHNG